MDWADVEFYIKKILEMNGQTMDDIDNIRIETNKLWIEIEKPIAMVIIQHKEAQQ